MMTPKMLHLLTAVLLRLTLAAGEDVSTLTRLEQSRLSNGAEGEDDGNRDWRAIIEDEDEVDWAQTIIVDNPPLASLQSTFQNIEVFNSDHFGKVFVLDDCLQLTERDAPHYNEMLAHVPVMEYLARRDGKDDDPMRALVVGGGDGYVVSELLKYPQIGSIDHVELDEGVVNISQKFFPWAENVWNDERVNLVIGDGAEYVKQSEKSYHVIIQDASDPFWYDEDGNIETLPSSVLFEESHFQSLFGLLKPNEGVLVMQAETYNIPSNLESIRKWGNILHEKGFEKPRYGSISIGTYPTGQIGFFVAHASKIKDDTCVSSDDCEYKMDTSPEVNWNRVVAQYKQLTGETLYYHPRIHRSAFDLPLWVEEVIYGKDSVVLKA